MSPADALKCICMWERVYYADTFDVSAVEKCNNFHFSHWFLLCLKEFFHLILLPFFKKLGIPQAWDSTAVETIFFFIRYMKHIFNLPFLTWDRSASGDFKNIQDKIWKISINYTVISEYSCIHFVCILERLASDETWSSFLVMAHNYAVWTWTLSLIQTDIKNIVTKREIAFNKQYFLFVTLFSTLSKNYTFIYRYFYFFAKMFSKSPTA